MTYRTNTPRAECARTNAEKSFSKTMQKPEKTMIFVKFFDKNSTNVPKNVPAPLRGTRRAKPTSTPPSRGSSTFLFGLSTREPPRVLGASIFPFSTLIISVTFAPANRGPTVRFLRTRVSECQKHHTDCWTLITVGLKVLGYPVNTRGVQDRPQFYPVNTCSVQDRPQLCKCYPVTTGYKIATVGAA